MGLGAEHSSPRNRRAVVASGVDRYHADRVPYELTCPACAHKVVSPFIRVGAVVVCARCTAKYRIADDHVRKTSGAAAPPKQAVADADAVVIAAEEAESSARQLSDGSVAGLSGLSELMDQEPDAAAESEAAELPPAGRIPSANLAAGSESRTARQHARRDVRRRNVRLLYLLAGVLGLMMAGIGGGLWWAVVSDRDVSLPPPTANEIPLSATDAAMIAALPLLTAEELPEVVWERVDEPRRLEARDRSVYLRDEARAFTEDGKEYYTATVAADTADIVTEATLRLVLIDMTDRAIARGAAPLALFGGGRQQKVRVPFPNDLPPGLLRVDSWVEVEKKLPTGRYLADAEVRSVAPGSRTLLRLRSINQHPLMLHDTVVVLRALDETGAIVARYEVKVPWPLDPGMQLAVRIALPPPGPARSPRQWVAEAAGSTGP